MAQQRFLSPDRLYERPFAAAHPFVRSPSAPRRWTMLCIFVLLCAIIGAYLYVTDAKRVRRLAESELSRLLGGPVTVEKAKLSIFEGLRLENVNVFVDRENALPQSRLFSAATFLVSYDPKALLTGNLKLTQIIAIDPQVQLIEDLDTGKWNYQRMSRPNPPASNPTNTANLPTLPEIILRNAQIAYSELRSGQLVSRGSMTLEGQLAPSSDGQRYSFELQSRGGDLVNGSVTVGPTVSGVFVRNTGLVTAQLRDFQFGQDVRSMLPAEVRSWWDRHDLTGAVDVPILSYVPPRDGDPARFKVETDLHGVNLTVRPEEWMSRDELETHDMAAGAFEAMRMAGLDSHGVVGTLAKLVEPSPLQLSKVDGRFVFTESGITIGQFDEHGKVAKAVSGTLETNEFALDGKILGYSPQAPVTVHMASKKIQIPKSPRYIASAPHAVRELYEHLRPAGLAMLDMKIARNNAGERIDVSGVVTVVDGTFVFDRFPYPVRNATGTVKIGYDAATQMDEVRINMQGYGAAGGPNEKGLIRIFGRVAPLNGDPSVVIKINADSVQDEPRLFAAFPPEVKETLRNLDADGKGLFPKFRGSFECRVFRPVGPHVEWIIDTDINLLDAAGKMVVFPYFMDHVTGKLQIREGYVDIMEATTRMGDSSLVIDGRVTWRAGVGRPLEAGEVLGTQTSPRPDLKITARNVPLDQKLLDALPEDRRVWMEKAGLKGTIDIDGRVWKPNAEEAAKLPKSPDHSALAHAFDITLRDGSIWPIEGGAVVSKVAAKLHLLPDRMVVNDMRGKRGDGDLQGHGEVAWPDNKPHIFFSGTAGNLTLDSTLYKVLPAIAQRAWDQVKPEGVVDLDLSFKGDVGGDDNKPSPATQASIADGAPVLKPTVPDIDLIIHPRTLAVTVQAVPYKLDKLTGTVRVTGNKVTLTDITGVHGPAKVRVTGGSVVGDTSTWDLRLGASDVTVDNEFRKALPGGLASLVDSLKLTGKIAFDFSKLNITTLPTPAVATAANPPTTGPASTPADVDFAVKLTATDVSLDVGVPMTKANGMLDLTGTVRNNKLAAFEGPMDFPSLTIASRDAKDVHAEFYKPADQDALRIGHIQGRLAEGDVAGQVDLAFPESSPSTRYRMNLVLRNADVRELSGDAAPDLSGEMSASLALEGDSGSDRSRRGRGDVQVRGKEMYKIPLVLGLLQITNLSLPITSPFSDGSARYTVEGQTVTFETLELRSRDMLMSGSGQLNFATKKVAMTFTTDNPNWPRIPILGDLVTTAKHELLQFHVKGSLQDVAPANAATQPANTITTTVDEVQTGQGKK